MTEENEFDPEEERLRQLGEQEDSFEREHEDDPSYFQRGCVRGVKQITGMRWDRAREKFRDFLESQGHSKEEVEQLLLKYRQKGFSDAKIIRLQKEFAAWWKEEKSRKARESRKQRRKRGRVRSKNDKRVGAARYKGKRIPSQKKI